MSASRPCRFNPGVTAPGTHTIGCWMAPSAGLDHVEKNLLPLLGIEPRLLGRPARRLVSILLRSIVILAVSNYAV
jgi:hypothetical protein